ncbi:RhuM family protein [Methanobrevibacter arboriphilus]|jgi:hypothetical protein|uniref:Uncharacterized protein n=1 Tax=Methanobrevibacter arboriphilus TaxID=39441 RepID=A0ACA8R2I0_METAZ|nr:RhuM family protein [Methanobrevibacter arboriphilus]BBL61487.1 hypothetical protein MarbSA_05270 [Methanobrevibacter arboriphilus]
MNELMNFENEEFGKITVLIQNNEYWFVGKEIATKLGYKKTRNALKRHVDDEDKGVAKQGTLGGKQDMTIINESGLYSLILSSKLKTAKSFKKWLTKEVLPSIRKDGYYIKEDKKEQALQHLKKLRSESTHVQKVLNELFIHATDYEPSSLKIGEFYGTMQNKLYQAVTDSTAKELVYYRADHTKPHMGLTTWEGKKDVTKSDVKIGKNYLTKDELDLLVRIINMMIDVIDIKLRMKKEFTIDYVISVFDHYLKLVSEKEVTGYGVINKIEAENNALSELKKYRCLLNVGKEAIGC